YITVGNENYVQPPMPKGVEEGILKGMYRFRASQLLGAGAQPRARVQLLGSGAILNEVVAAQELLEERYGVAADVWSVTSYKNLYWDGIDAERWNMLHPASEPRVPYVTECLQGAGGP